MVPLGKTHSLPHRGKLGVLNKHDVKIVITVTSYVSYLGFKIYSVQVILPYGERILEQTHGFCGHSLTENKSSSVTVSGKHSFNSKSRMPSTNYETKF